MLTLWKPKQHFCGKWQADSKNHLDLQRAKNCQEQSMNAWHTKNCYKTIVTNVVFTGIKGEKYASRAKIVQN